MISSIKSQHLDFYIAVVYRSFSGHNLAEFLAKLDCFSDTYKYILITGDFNYDLLVKSYGSTHLKNVMYERGLHRYMSRFGY